MSHQKCRHHQDPDCKLLLEPGSTESGVSCNRYLENVPTIVPLLEREFRSAAAKLHETQARWLCCRIRQMARLAEEATVALLHSPAVNQHVQSV